MTSTGAPWHSCKAIPANGTLSLMEIALAIRGVKHLEQRWMVVPPGGTLRLSWPLARAFFAGAVP
jgi:hypothetical protein